MVSQIQGKRLIAIYVDEPVYREIKIYAAETGRYIQDIIKPMSDDFIQNILKMLAEIKEMKRQAELKRQKEEEDAKLVAENPIVVSGKEEDPLGSVIESQTC